jgi:hypothetical protein
VEGKRFTRTFASFVGRDAASRWVAEYDASLEGIAIIWFLLRGTLEVAVGCAAVSLESLGLKEVGSSMMNTVEFIAATLAIRGLVARGERGVSITVRGDNKSAMTWATKGTYKSSLAMRAAVVHVAQNVKAEIEVVEMLHLPHTAEYDYNWRCDLPSRGLATWKQVIERDRHDQVSGSRLNDEMEEWGIPGWEGLVALCDPLSSEAADESFVRRVLETV